MTNVTNGFYTFAEYLEDYIICTAGYAVNATAKELLVAWDMYSEVYVTHCKREGYEYEVINEI